MTATLLAMAPLAPIAPLSPCDYVNVNGHCRPSPDYNQSQLPDKDGTWSHSENKQGSGSHHGGTGHSR
jgi:hypothetical protein